MRTDTVNQYEAMFLFDPTFGASFEQCEAEIRRLMERASAEVVFCKKWDERRLAYKLKGRKRGVYVLVYFKAPTAKIAGLERDVQISENVLRVLTVRADGVTPELMEKALTMARSETGPGSGGRERPEWEFEDRPSREGKGRRRGGRRGHREGDSGDGRGPAETAEAPVGAAE